MFAEFNYGHYLRNDTVDIGDFTKNAIFGRRTTVLKESLENIMHSRFQSKKVKLKRYSEQSKKLS